MPGFFVADSYVTARGGKQGPDFPQFRVRPLSTRMLNAGGAIASQPLPYLLTRFGKVIKVCYDRDARPDTAASFVRINEEFRARPVDLATARR